MQQLPQRSSQPSYTPSSQALSMPYAQISRPLSSNSAQPSAPPFHNPMPGVGGPGAPFGSSYTVRIQFNLFFLLALYKLHQCAYFHSCLLFFSLHHLLASNRIMLVHHLIFSR